MVFGYYQITIPQEHFIAKAVWSFCRIWMVYPRANKTKYEFEGLHLFLYN